MKLKIVLFIICCSGLSTFSSAQQYAIDKKATIISASLSSLSQGGDLFEDSEGNKALTITFKPSINHFVTRNIFIGAGLEYLTESQGDYESDAVSVGPHIGYSFGDSESPAFPFLDLGVRYYSMNAYYDTRDDIRISGSDIFLGFGIIVPVKTHIGLIFEGGYHLLEFRNKDSNDSASGNTISFGIGFAGLLFKKANQD